MSLGNVLLLGLLNAKPDYSYQSCNKNHRTAIVWDTFTGWDACGWDACGWQGWQ